MDSDNLSMEGLAKRACKKESVFTFKGASAQKHAVCIVLGGHCGQEYSFLKQLTPRDTEKVPPKRHHESQPSSLRSTSSFLSSRASLDTLTRGATCLREPSVPRRHTPSISARTMRTRPAST